MKESKLISKRFDGIKYFSNKVDVSGLYRFWESKSHPKFSHWTATKKGQ